MQVELLMDMYIYTTQAHNGRSETNIPALHENVAESSETPMRHGVQEMDIAIATLKRILIKELTNWIIEQQKVNAVSYRKSTPLT